MKVGVVTFWYSNDNYGQLLQCYALQKYLDCRGIDAFLIKYLPKTKKFFFQKIINHMSLQDIKYYFSKDAKNSRKRAEIVNKNSVNRKFDDFRDNYIKSTSCVYTSYEELYNFPPEADAYICGSDQIWQGPLKNKNVSIWFLNFGTAKRIAYAASFGKKIAENERDIFISYLGKFDAISVRENSAQKYCRNLGFQNVDVVLDPTLLLKESDYKKIMLDIHENNKFVFLYILNMMSVDDFYWNEISEYINEKNFDIKFVSSSGCIPAMDSIDNYENLQLTIPEWLSYINKSEHVITSSYHGVIFSIIMHKSFVAIPLNGKYAEGNERLYTLLQTLELNERLVKDKGQIKNILDKPIDWNIVDNLLEEQREKSEKFLKQALSIKSIN